MPILPLPTTPKPWTMLTEKQLNRLGLISQDSFPPHVNYAQRENCVNHSLKEPVKMSGPLPNCAHQKQGAWFLLYKLWVSGGVEMGRDSERVRAHAERFGALLFQRSSQQWLFSLLILWLQFSLAFFLMERGLLVYSQNPTGMPLPDILGSLERLAKVRWNIGVFWNFNLKCHVLSK